MKKMITIKPVRYQKDSKGNLIPVYRQGYRETNKYAKKTPQQIEDEKHIGDKNYERK